ncbi:amino acid ABC transporter substrate-binding protein [Paenibacillus sp. GCM10028914]|uniref:amino acid ABC transporter substrate-binding protein n=1 Tax=Paenibacillus sp. GCM10028914 TaxID=3273416 RepID=UPI00360E1A87
MRKTLLFMMSILLLLSVIGCSTADKSASGEKELIVGIDDKFAPMGFRDEKNEIVGFDIDYARATVEKMGYKVKFQPIDWKTKESELMSGRIDLIWNGYTITEDRVEKVLFSKPYLKNSQVVAVKADSDIHKISDLAGKNVGLQGLSSAADALDANEIKSQIKSVTEFADNVLALSDLKNGRVDAVIIDEVVINYYMAKEEGTYKLLEDSLAPEEYGIGVKKGREDLLKELQTALDALNSDGTSAEISTKWFGEDKVLK